MRRVRHFLLHAPVTISLLVTMLVCAWVTDSIASRLSYSDLERLGCAPADLLSSRAWCAITSLPFTWGGFSFLGLLPFVALSAGTTERALGSTTTMGIFLGTHVFAAFAEALILLALVPSLGPPLAGSLLSAPDVGPSAGCFGALIARRSPRGQMLSAGLLTIFLAAIVWWRPAPGFSNATLWLSDVAHPVAALAGYGYARFRQRTPSRVESR